MRIYTNVYATHVRVLFMNIEKKKRFISVVVLQKWFYHLKCLIFGQVCSVYYLSPVST